MSRGDEKRRAISRMVYLQIPLKGFTGISGEDPPQLQKKARWMGVCRSDSPSYLTGCGICEIRHC